MGDEFKAKLGDGNFEALTEADPITHTLRHIEFLVGNQMEIWEAKRPQAESLGLSIPSRDELWNDAVRAVLPGVYAEIEKNEVTATVQKNTRLQQTRPTNRNGATLSEDDSIRQNVNDILGAARQRSGMYE